MRHSRLSTWRLLFWLPPLLLTSRDAHAWGLVTHLYLAQLLLWVLPLADPNLRRAVRRFPEQVLAGACLPDLALVGRRCGTTAFAHSHRWETGARLWAAARDEREAATALGYVSHLVADVPAHHFFVPAFEAHMGRRSLLLHAAAEWAMDARLARHLQTSPRALLRAHRDYLGDYAARHFGCTKEVARASVTLLGRADGFLRASRLPAVLGGVGRLAGARLDDWLAPAVACLTHVERVGQGETPVWDAEGRRRPDGGPGSAGETGFSGVRAFPETAVFVQARVFARAPASLGGGALPAVQAPGRRSGLEDAHALAGRLFAHTKLSHALPAAGHTSSSG